MIQSNFGVCCFDSLVALYHYINLVLEEIDSTDLMQNLDYRAVLTDCGSAQLKVSFRPFYFEYSWAAGLCLCFHAILKTIKACDFYNCKNHNFVWSGAPVLRNKFYTNDNNENYRFCYIIFQKLKLRTRIVLLHYRVSWSPLTLIFL